MVSYSVVPGGNSGASLQWSHVFSDMVRVAETYVTYHATIKLQWSHVFSDMVR